MTPEVGQRLDGYRLLRKIGEGGMSVVFLGLQRESGFRRQVAIKVLREEREGALRRFHAERQILASLEHPHIAQLFDVGTLPDGRPYLVMELVQGRLLDDYCDAERLGIRDRLRLFQKICSAVHYAHQNLVVHRDLKPGNIMVGRDGEPKLLDFGIAKLLRPAEGPHPQSTGLLERVLTPDYASPEQLMGGRITTASDIYSLGVILFRLLSGHLPFEDADSGARQMERVLAEDSPESLIEAVGRSPGTQDRISALRGVEPRGLRRVLDGDLDWIVARALHRDPRQRYASPEELAADIERYLNDHPVVARRGNVGYRWLRFWRRHRLGLSAAAGLGLLLLAGAISFAVQAERLRAARDQAELERHSTRQMASFLEEIFVAADPRRKAAGEVTARDLLDETASRISTQMSGQAELQAELLATLGNVYRVLGSFGKAENLLLQAVDLDRARLPAADPLLGQRLDSLGGVYLEQGRYDEAERVLRQAVELQRGAQGPERAALGGSLSTLGATLMQLNRLGEARELMEEGLMERQATLPAADPELAESHNNLGLLAYEEGRYDAAAEHLEKAVEIHRQTQGDVHPDVAAITVNLGVIRDEQGRMEEARDLYRRALAIQRRAFEGDHPATAQTMTNLATLQTAIGELEPAAALYDEALTIQIALLGEDHPEVARVRGNLGRLQTLMGRYDEAEDTLGRSLATFRRLYGGGPHDEIGWVLGSLAELAREQGRPAAAEPLFRRQIEELLATVGPEHPDLATARAELGLCLVELGRLDEAESLLREAQGSLRRQLGEDDPIAQSRIGFLAAVHLQRGEWAEAEALLTEPLAQARLHWGDRNVLSRRLAAWLAEAYAGQGKSAAAAELRRRLASATS